MIKSNNRTLLIAKYVFLLLSIINTAALCQSGQVTRWELNSLSAVGGYTTTVLGNPKLINTSLGKAIEFDGIDDGLQLNANPIINTTEFTVEVLFKPYSRGNKEQRFVHFEQDDNNRLLIELRTDSTSGKHIWFLDTFIKSGTSSRTLYVESSPTASDVWVHGALVFKGGTMSHYVNGKEQTSGNVSFIPVTTGKTSLGVRLNKVNWYKGAIKTVKVTAKAIQPSEFITSETAVLNGTIAGRFEQNQELDFHVSFPTEDKVEVRFLLLQPEIVTVKIYDYHGREVAASSMNECSGGTHIITIPTHSAFPSIVIVQVTAQNKVYSKKMFRTL